LETDVVRYPTPNAVTRNTIEFGFWHAGATRDGHLKVLRCQIVKSIFIKTALDRERPEIVARSAAGDRTMLKIGPE
jgi:hypothetical protein